MEGVTPVAGLWRRLTGSLSATTQDLEDVELQESSGKLGASRIREVADRELADVSGVIKSLTLPPLGTVPALTAELYDGTGTLTLVWLGRRAIQGIEPGTYLRSRGRVTYRRGVPTVFNPVYEILPRNAT